MPPNLFVRWYRRLSVKKRDSQCPTVIDFIRATGWRQDGQSGFWFHEDYGIRLRLPQAVYLECRRQHRRDVRRWRFIAAGFVAGAFLYGIIRDFVLVR